MNESVRDSIESARSVAVGPRYIHGAEPQRKRSFDSVRAIVLAVVQELPSDMTVAELTEELLISEAQRSNE